MINVLLCGGAGTRLWPISCKSSPKQFCKLVDDVSLYQQALMRNSEVCAGTIAVVSADHLFRAHSQAEEVSASSLRFIIEPCGRGTAGAIALACMEAGADDVVLVTPSDHRIQGQAEYARIMRRAEELAQKGFIVTFGVAPSRPETGYGYIEAAGQEVIAFREKPDFETARRYVEEGGAYWNSGIFCFRAGIYLAELKKHAPEIHAASLKAFERAGSEGQTRRIQPEDMRRIPQNSIDRAIMEKSGIVRMLEAPFAWADLGSFDAVYEAFEKDADGNARKGNVLPLASRNNLVMAAGKPIALVEVEDLIVVDTREALLVTKRGQSQKVAQVTGLLEATAPPPEAEPCTVRKVTLPEGHELRLQGTRTADEHWLVVEGVAVVELQDGARQRLLPRASYVPCGNEWRLVNEGQGNVTLVITGFKNRAGDDAGDARENRNGETLWLSSLAG